MDREVLFRGKGMDGGWICGNLIYDEISDSAAILTYVNLGGDAPKIIDLSEINCYRIILETVGQYSGFTDKTGRKIFEGDKVKVIMNRLTGEETIMTGSIECIKGSFSVTWDDEEYGRSFLANLKNVEIIGNIYDGTHGHWDDSFDGITPMCSVCEMTHHDFIRCPKFCPYYVAKMDGDKNANA